MDSTHLFYFKAIAETKSLTKAARKLYISQPALSKSLSVLEKELGRKLFNRINGRLVLNKDGEELLKYANEMELIFRNINRYFQKRNDTHAPLNIYSIDNNFSFIMKNYYSYDTRPVKLKVLAGDALAASLYNGDADAIIADDTVIRPNPDLGLKRIHLLSEQLCIIVPKGHDLSHKKSVHITELSDYTFMHKNSNQWLPRILELNHITLPDSWSVDAETWNYYWQHYTEDMPLCFETSASFYTQGQLKKRLEKCALIKVEGEYTQRMLYLWYFDSSQEKLSEFIECVKFSFI